MLGPSKKTTSQKTTFLLLCVHHKGFGGKRAFHKSTSVEVEVGLLVINKVKQTTCTEGVFRLMVVALCTGGLGLGEGSHTSFLLLLSEDTVKYV